MSQMYLGRMLRSGKTTADRYRLNNRDLTTHVFICGSTGSGKTVLGKCILEEAVLTGVPAVIIDLKGDLSSLKIPLFDLSENELADYVEGYSDEDQKEKIKKNIAEFKHMLSNSGLGISDIQSFRNKANIRIFTPKSRVCEPVSMSFLTSPPGNFEEIMRIEPETILNHIANQVSNILKRLFGENAILSMHEEKNLMEAAVLHLYKNNAELEGKSGIISLIKAIYDVPFDRIGMLKVKEFISDERKMNLIRRLNTLLIGAESLWYEGESIDRVINSLVDLSKTPEDKTNVYIFNLSFLENFDDRNLILSNIAVTLFNQMKKLGDSKEPRALFYIDEIGGGKLSFFPDDPVQNESKSSINLLLRQGRAFGLCCVLSTQNPGDIDYRGLTNCHTWYIGKLLTKADRDKVIQGISATPYFIESYENFLKSAGSGDFIVKSKDGTISAFKERWLLTFHKVLTYDDFVKLKKHMFFADDLLDGANCMARKDYKGAAASFEKILEKSPDSSKATGFLGEAYFGQGAYKDALLCFEKILKSKDNDYSQAKAYYFMGEIAMAGGHQDRALEFYQRSVKADAEYSEPYYRIAQIQNLAARNAEALQNVQKHIVLKPGSDEGYYLMSKIQTALQDFFAAETSVKKAFAAATSPEVRYRYKLFEAKVNYYLCQYAHSLEIIEEAKKFAAESGTGHVECEMLLASIYSKFKENSKAVACLEDVITANPSDEEALTRLAELYYSEKQADKVAETVARLSMVNPHNINIYNFKARALLDSGKKEDAMKLVEMAPRVSAGADLIETTRGLIYEALGNQEKALASYRAATEINPRSEEAMYLISQNHSKLGELEKQAELLLKIIEFAPDEKYYYDLGLCYEKLNRYQQAIDAFSHLYMTALQDPDVILKKADWYRKTSNLPKAYECIEQFMKSRPGSQEGYIIKGEIYTMEKKYDEALDAYDRAERLSKGDLKVWLSRAFTYKEMGDYDKAEFCQNKAFGRE